MSEISWGCFCGSPYEPPLTRRSFDTCSVWMYLVKIAFHGTGFLAVKAAVEAVVEAAVVLSIDDDEAVIAVGGVGFTVEVEFSISLA